FGRRMRQAILLLAEAEVSDGDLVENVGGVTTASRLGSSGEPFELLDGRLGPTREEQFARVGESQVRVDGTRSLDEPREHVRPEVVQMKIGKRTTGGILPDPLQRRDHRPGALVLRRR